MEKNHVSFLRKLFGENEESRKKIFRSMKAQADAKRTIMEKMADWMTSKFGNSNFLWLNVVFFAVWILINTNQIKKIPPFPCSYTIC